MKSRTRGGSRSYQSWCAIPKVFEFDPYEGTTSELQLKLLVLQNIHLLNRSSTNLGTKYFFTIFVSHMVDKKALKYGSLKFWSEDPAMNTMKS